MVIKVKAKSKDAEGESSIVKQMLQRFDSFGDANKDSFILERTRVQKLLKKFGSFGTDTNKDKGHPETASKGIFDWLVLVFKERVDRKDASPDNDQPVLPRTNEDHTVDRNINSAQRFLEVLEQTERRDPTTSTIKGLCTTLQNAHPLIKSC